MERNKVMEEVLSSFYRTGTGPAFFYPQTTGARIKIKNNIGARSTEYLWSVRGRSLRPKKNFGRPQIFFF